MPLRIGTDVPTPTLRPAPKPVRAGWAPAAYPAGLVALAAGAGIGLPYARETGLTFTTTLGLAGAAIGLALAAWGGARVVGAAPRWWKVPVTAGLVVIAFVVVSTLGVAVAATTVPPTELGSSTPANLGLAYTDVVFPASDGVELSGWYVPSTNGAAVVVLHGSGSTRTDVLNQVQVLARNGFGVLAYDARGHGLSDGRAMDFGWYGDLDVEGAVSFLTDQPDVVDGRIGLLGMSMGGEQAIGSLAADPRVMAVVAEGATNRVAADKEWLSEVFGVRGAIQEGLDAVTYGLTDLLTAAEPPITLGAAALSAAPRPVLLITAGSVPDEGHAAAYIQGFSPSTVEVWTVPGATHTGGLAAAGEEWDRRVTGFFSAGLDVAAG
jgi:uncharacterized protein